MGWFSKKKGVEKKENSNLNNMNDIPKLPELPRLGNDPRELPKLPSYPSSSLGEKFSRNVIKEAVSGKDRGEGGAFNDKDDFDSEEIIQRPPSNIPRKPRNIMKEEVPEIRMPSSGMIRKRTMETEPVFVRIDKFDESLDIFDKTKKKIEEMEKLLGDIKHIREKEEGELRDWESEIQTIKKQFEKIDNNLFSKI